MRDPTAPIICAVNRYPRAAHSPYVSPGSPSPSPASHGSRNLSPDPSSDTDTESTDADLALPYSSSPDSHDADRVYFPHQPKSLSGIAIRSFCLGITLALGLTGTLILLLFTASPLWRLPFFLAALSLFHFLEFWTTAAYNTRAADVSSFILTSNWPGYAVAHTVATLECLLTHTLLPLPLPLPLPRLPVVVAVAVGLALVVLGQAVRSAAMVQAGPSFNHTVQRRRGAGHVLVTAGVYARLRHPSYFGFFWWALGTQLVMGNVLCLAGYAAVLWRFFSGRIRHEEELLVRFFGAEYVAYRARVGTWIPFVP